MITFGNINSKMTEVNGCLRKMRNILPALSLAVAALAGSLTSCTDDDFDNSAYYKASKRTAAQLISDNPESFSLFQGILEKANYFSTLSTYGTYTVFAPDNDAVKKYLEENHYASIDEIPVKTCDTIARNHIVSKGAYFTTDYSDGALPAMNMDDRYLVITCDSSVSSTGDKKVKLFVNKRSEITHKDDSVTNGVVHVIDRVLAASNLYLPDLMLEDESIKIFTEALFLTNMKDSLSAYIDNSYYCDDDSVTKGVPNIRFGGKDMVAHYPEKRFFKFTAFIEPDSIFNKHGIYTIDDLIEYAKKVYNETYPEDAGLYDDDYKNRKNPLNRFVSYHLFDRMGNYGDWAPSGEVLTTCCRTDIADAEDFWETMCPGTMLRFCRANGQLYANRKGLKNKYVSGCKGVRVYTDSESGKHNQVSLNGRYFYIDDILKYDTNVRDKVLNCRMRIDATTLCADFMNQGARGNLGWDENYLFAMKNGFIKNWKTTPETFVAVHCDNVWWSSYLGNAVAIKGQYDVQIKLPCPPPGLYEIRLGYVASDERGVVQVYLNNEPCGIPVDLRIGSWAPEIGVEADTDDDEANTAQDKALHNRGFMKGMDSYGKPGATNFRVDAPEHVRRILTTAQFSEGGEYWLRFRQVLEGNAEWSFDYIELCPKSVYASPEGEDRH